MSLFEHSLVQLGQENVQTLQLFKKGWKIQKRKGKRASLNVEMKRAESEPTPLAWQRRDTGAGTLEAPHGLWAGRRVNHTLCHGQNFGLGFWLALLFSRLNLCSSHQNLPTSHGATCITPSPIYTPKGKPGRKAGALEDGKHTALWRQSSRGSGRNEEEAAGE